MAIITGPNKTGHDINRGENPQQRQAPKNPTRHDINRGQNPAQNPAPKNPTTHQINPMPSVTRK